MFDALAEALRELELPPDADAIAEAIAWRDVLDAKIALALGGLDARGLTARGLAEETGAVSTVAWLRAHCRRSGRTASQMVRTARTVAAWPVLADAWADGAVSSGQVEAVVANVGRHHARFAQQEAAIVPALEPLGVDATTVAMRAWRAKVDALDDGPAPDDRPDTLHLSRTLDGRGELRASLGADLAEVVATAIRTVIADDPARPVPERRAEALGEVCRQFLAAQGPARRARRRRHRPHVNVVVTYESLATSPEGRYVDGPPVGPAALQAMLCDAEIHRVVVQGRSTILDYGRSTRTIPGELFHALVLRDEGCRWPGCDRPAAWCEGHHVESWYHGGATALDNIVLLCSRHHHRLHQPGWRAKLLPDATFELTRPDGTTESSPPPGPIRQQFW